MLTVELDYSLYSVYAEQQQRESSKDAAEQVENPPFAIWVAPRKSISEREENKSDEEVDKPIGGECYCRESRYGMER